jgi:hypothetical protein
MKKENKFLELVKATRIERSLIPLSSIMLVIGFANKINYEIFILSICCIFGYSIGGIFNAKTDKDFKIKNPNKIIIVLSVILIILSLFNKIIFLTVLASLLLNVIYNKYSRFILFGDSIILSLTHSTLPIVSAALLLNLNLKLTTTIASFMFFSMFLIIPMKNLNRIKEDKKNKYKTLLTKYKNGKKLTNFLFQIYFVFIILAYFIFNLNYIFLIGIIPIFILKTIIDYNLNNKKEIFAYELSRFLVILFIFFIVYSKTSNIRLIILNSSLIFLYLIYLSINKNGKI